MIETRRLKNIVIFIQTILSFVLSRKIEFLQWLCIQTYWALMRLYSFTFEICCCWRNRNCRHAGITNWIADNKGPISFVDSIKMVCFSNNKLLHCSWNLFNFSLVKDSVIVTGFIIRSENSILKLIQLSWFKTIFLDLAAHLNAAKEKYSWRCNKTKTNKQNWYLRVLMQWNM